MMEGMPHIYRVMTSELPPGALRCGCCDRMARHTEIGAFDEDLGAYVCFRCVIPLAGAEWVLLEGMGVRRPEMVETPGLEMREEREVTGER